MLKENADKSDSSFVKNDKKRNLNFFGYLSFVIIMILFLYLFQNMIISGEITAESTHQYIILDYESPNIISLFLSQFSHDLSDPEHLLNNVLSFLIISITIGLIYFFSFPKIEIELPKYYLIAVYIQIILVVPVMISLISYIYREIGVIDESIRYSVGFSGIVWALIGFMLYLIAILCLKTLSVGLRDHGDDFGRIVTVCLPLLFIISLMIILPVFLIIVDTNTDVNIYAHLTGFAYGWLIPSLTGSLFMYSCLKCRVAIITFISLIFIIPSLIAGFIMNL